MTTYEWLLFGHLVFVIAWVGTNIGTQVLSLRMMGATPQRRVEFLADVEWVGTRLLIPSALAVVVFGLLLVNEGNYDLGKTWLLVALAAFAFSFIVGAGFLGPESGRVAALAEERGPEAPEIEARTRRVLLVSRIELLILILVVLDMIAKPGL
jgi:uncharacterized membrane protein